MMRRSGSGSGGASGGNGGDEGHNDIPVLTAVLRWLRARWDGMEERRRRRADAEIAVSLYRIADSLSDIVRLLTPRAADTLRLRYILGGSIMGVPVSMNVGDTAAPTVIETAVGVVVAPIGPLVFASDNPAVASVDPSTGVVAGVSAGVAHVSVVDQGNGLSDSVEFTIVGITPPPPPPADTLSLSFAVTPAPATT